MPWALLEANDPVDQAKLEDYDRTYSSTHS